MNTLVIILLLGLFTTPITANSPSPPSPGYTPSSHFTSLGFDQAYTNLWGPTHQRVDNGSLTIWLDSSSGSGFKSLRLYRNAYIGAAIKLHSGYTAGVNTCLYLSNNQDRPNDHDEIDIEFLGTIPGEPYTLQTNVYSNGSDVGREVRHHLWFDPTQDFHNYAIQWTSDEIIFFVDDVPIRRYLKKSETTAFPVRPMWVYGSIWDASSWATDGGRYKAQYKYQPFLGRYKDFKIGGCAANADASCLPPTVSPTGSGGLSRRQLDAMEWVWKNHLVYNYCNDANRDRSQIPEC